VLAFNAANNADAGAGLLFGLSAETLAIFPFLSLSAAIFCFDPVKRPALLVYAGFFGIAGGALLIAAGIALSGAAVILSSLEMARGGRQVLLDALRSRTIRASAFSRFTLATVCSLSGLSAYSRAVARLTRRSPFLDRSLNGHPLVAGMLIQGASRFGMIIGGLMAGQIVVALIGISWLFGDILVGLNDAALRAWIGRALTPRRIREAA
jgi:hypothetical protein